MDPLPFRLRVPGQDELDSKGARSISYRVAGLLHLDGEMITLEWAASRRTELGVSALPRTDVSHAAEVRFEGGNPIFRVESLPASIDYYVRILGFKLDWQDSDIIASVSRGRFVLFLCQRDQGNIGCWVWVGVDDVEALFKEYRVAGAKVRHPPTNYSWAYEMQVEDLDGNVLRLGSEPKVDRPVGEWLDMRGHTWIRSSDGGWKRVESG